MSSTLLNPISLTGNESQDPDVEGKDDADDAMPVDAAPSPGAAKTPEQIAEEKRSDDAADDAFYEPLITNKQQAYTGQTT